LVFAFYDEQGYDKIFRGQPGLGNHTAYGGGLAKYSVSPLQIHTIFSKIYPKIDIFFLLRPLLVIKDTTNFSGFGCLFRNHNHLPFDQG
jgi:hypothetical protein